MSSWSLEVRDQSGAHTCADCTKENTCESLAELERSQAALLAISNTDAHPTNSGWGVVRVTCYGFTPT